MSRSHRGGLGALAALAFFAGLIAGLPGFANRFSPSPTPTPPPTATASPTPTTTPTATPTATPTTPPTATPSPTPTPAPTATTVPAPRVDIGGNGRPQLPTIRMRMRIPKIGVDAPAVALGLKADGTMDAPDGPDTIGWYTFSATPGWPGNAVFSGHVDWHTGATGVFWDLHKLARGDAIVVRANDRDYNYSVRSSTTFRDEEAPIEEIVGPRPGETITLITCEGVFNPATRNYDLRRVVIAEAVL